MRDHFMFGKDELIVFECKFDKCKPVISSKMNNSYVLLHDIYPIIQVHLERCEIANSNKKENISKKSNIPISEKYQATFFLKKKRNKEVVLVSKVIKTINSAYVTLK
ncbi:hypothetical protein RFI_20779, partial [Reticulomyxa filosa]